MPFFSHRYFFIFSSCFLSSSANTPLWQVCYCWPKSFFITGNSLSLVGLNRHSNAIRELCCFFHMRLSTENIFFPSVWNRNYTNNITYRGRVYWPNGQFNPWCSINVHPGFNSLFDTTPLDRVNNITHFLSDPMSKIFFLVLDIWSTVIGRNQISATIRGKFVAK